jgi:glycosyltransferase involved in cell wall biosynthesis/protein-tyrosine-phosphatase
MPASPRALRLCHVLSADLSPEAERQVATSATYLISQPGVSVSAVLFNDGPLARELKRLAISVLVLDERATSSFGLTRRLTRFFQEHQIDLVHTHGYKDSVLGAVAAKLARVPHVVRTVHALREPTAGWEGLKLRVYEAVDRAALMCCADLVIGVSKQMTETLRKSGYRPTSVTQIHNGINLGAIAAHRPSDEVRRQLDIDPTAFVIGTAGRLASAAGYTSLLRAVRGLRDDHPGAICLVVGDGPSEKELRRQAASLGIADACRFTGAREDVHDVVGAMDVFVLPSMNNGMPTAALEAMALGKPVVASAVGGVTEVVEDGLNGLLVPAGDDRQLAAACVRLARDREYAQTLGDRARRLVEERFSHQRSGRALLAAYRSVALIPATRNHDVRDEHGARGARDRHGSTGRELDMRGFCWGSVRLFASRGTAKVTRWRTAQAMTRMRRNPAAVRTRLHDARSVLIVCHGNIIRSVFAARLVKAALNGTGAVSIQSAGLDAVAGRAVDPMALRAAQTRGIDLDGHTASRVTPELVAASDVVFVMDVDQVMTMRRRFPEAAGKTFLLTCLASAIPMEVRDPYDGDAAQFQRCFDQISKAVGPIIRTLGDRQDGAAPHGDHTQQGLQIRRAW